MLTLKPREGWDTKYLLAQCTLCMNENLFGSSICGGNWFGAKFLKDHTTTLGHRIDDD